MSDISENDDSFDSGAAACAPGFPSPGQQYEARRLRHSFRFCVLAAVVFTGMLWVAEKYMRYDLTESQFIAALTLETESSRAVLRQVVKNDAAKGQTPVPQYVAALAAREESDLVIPTYEKAYKLSPDSAAIAIAYGCKLFQAEKYSEARERFREAALQPGQGALPRYLEAAALAMSVPGAKDFGEALALVAKTNSGDKDVTLPQPIWSPVLPEGGLWHQKLRRQIADECCAPLYRFSDLITGVAKKQIALRQPQNWDAWLEAIQVMGQRVAFSGDASTVKTTAGICIQLQAIDRRLAIRELDGAPGDDLQQRKAKLTDAMSLVNKYEAQRDARIGLCAGIQKLPLFLAMETAAVSVMCFVLSYLFSKIIRTDRKWRALPHNALMGWLAFLGPTLLLALLLGMAFLQRSQGIKSMAMTADNIRMSGWMTPATIGWWLVVFAMLGAGWIYAGLRTAFFKRKAAEYEALNGPAGYRPHAVYALFLRRYYGVVTGLTLCAFCAWSILFRIFTDLYPWQIKLLTPGMAGQEAGVVAAVVKMTQGM